MNKLSSTKKLKKRDWALLIGAVVLYNCFLILSIHVANGATQELDEALMTWVYGIRSPGLSTVMEAITYVGNPASIILVLVLLLAFPKTRLRYGVPAVVVTLMTQSLKMAGKYIIQRPRPDAALFLVSESGYSFPSGHAIGTLSLYGLMFILLLYYRKKDKEKGIKPDWEGGAFGGLLVVTGFLAIAVGVSRPYVGVHYPTDILGGWLVAAATILVFLEVWCSYGYGLSSLPFSNENKKEELEQ